jgi:hypothetical protein
MDMIKITSRLRMYGTALLLGALLSVNATAQQVAVTAGEFTKVGLAGGQFLKIGVGARAMGMAGAYAGVANDITSVYWNPAGLVEVDGYAADFSHTFWFAGMNHSFAAFVIPVSEKYRVAASLLSFNSGDIAVTTTDRPDGTGGIYSVTDFAFGLTLAGYLTDQFSFGVTGRYVNHAFTNMSAGGFVFDIGTRYDTDFNGITLGFGINSLGTPQTFDGPEVTSTNPRYPGLNASPIDMQLQTSSFEMPLSFRAGIGVDMFQGFVSSRPEVDDDGTIVHQWLMAADFETYSDVPEQFAFGSEYTFREFVSFRAGYRFGSDQFGLSGGVGLKYESSMFKGRVDYSISPSNELGIINRLSIALSFE